MICLLSQEHPILSVLHTTNLPMFDCTLQLVWSKDFHERLTSDDLAKSVAEAERLLASHKERKVQSGWTITCSYVHCSNSG